MNFLRMLCNRPTALAKGCSPSQKQAVALSSLKRRCDFDVTDNFLSKIVEGHASMLLTCYLEANSLLPKPQWGFKKFQFTESLSTRILTEILLLIGDM